MEQQHIVVVGGSAGSLTLFVDLLAQLPQDFNAAIFVVMHLQRHVPSNLPEILCRRSPLPVSSAIDQQRIKPGHVYVAPPNYHLFIKPEEMLLVRGPLENRMRPAIDVLFRSAAVAYRNYVTGIILSGLLDDGVIGLQAVKRCGGYTIVQQPETARYPSMPENAINAVDVDAIVPVEKMGSQLIERSRFVPDALSSVPKDLQLESQMIERVMFNTEEMQQIGETVPQSCPACSGPLWQLKGSNILQYRCHVGHSFTARTLMEAQDDAAEEALWVALRTLEERGRLLERIGEDSHKKGAENLAKRYFESASEATNHANSIRKLLYSLGRIETSTEMTDEYQQPSSSPPVEPKADSANIRKPPSRD